MRHAVAGRKLGRDTNSRRALLNNLANSLFLNGQLKTTQAKAKFARPYVEKLITMAKHDRLWSNRILASTLGKVAFSRLTRDIAPGFGQRSGGYTRIINLNFRRGDSAPMAKLEIIEWDKSKKKIATPKNKKSSVSIKKQSKKSITKKIENKNTKTKTNKSSAKSALTKK